jgi:streptogramin lyase
VDEDFEIDFAAPPAAVRAGQSSLASRTANKSMMVSFVDNKGRVWTTEMTLPEITNMDTLLNIAAANIDLMVSKGSVKVSDLVVLVEPEDKVGTTLRDVDRVVVMHRTQVQRLEN